MRFPTILIALILSVFLPAASANDTDLQKEFAARLAAALTAADEDARKVAISALFHQEGLDEMTRGFLARAVNMLVRTHRHNIAFARLPEDTNFLHVLDGYEYRPNLIPLGYAVLTSPDDEPGNDTRIPYGIHPDGDRYMIPSSVRRLVNADAKPDKQLQMIAIGMATPAQTFTGWCDISLSNGTTARLTLGDEGHGNQTRIKMGQRIEACELEITSGRGSLWLQLMEDQETIFDERVETPVRILTYQAPPGG